MDNKIINGRELAKIRQQKLIEQIKNLPHAPKIVSILIGNDIPSVLYTKIKQQKAEEIGILFEAAKFPEITNFSEVADTINRLNLDSTVDGIMVQLPLPEKFIQGKSDKELLDLIIPEKDVDGLRNIGPFLSATAKSVLSILKDEGILVMGEKVVVVGTSDLVGKPVAEELRKIGANVESCDSKTEALKTHTLAADILISATGVPGLITGDMVKDGVIVIDVGAEKVNGKLVGDIDFESVLPKVSKITPVPGGVGPMTVISLMENVVEAVYNK